MTPRRDHVALTMAFGLLASLAVHLPVYGALGVLADKLLASAPEERRSPPADDGMMVEFDLAAEEEAEAPEPEQSEPEETEDTDVEGELAEEVEATAEDQTPEPEPEEEEEEEAEETLATPVQPPPDNLHAVTQRSQDPTVEVPDDPRFIAEENNRVDEETVARIRSMVQDDPDPNAGEPQEESEAPEEGNADEELVREMEEREAEDERLASDATQAERENTAREEERTGGEGDGSERERVEAERARRANAGGSEEMETIVVSDGIGTFTITRPRRSAEGSGGGEAGGERRAGREERRASGGGAGGAGPNLQIGWSQFEAVMGEEQLEREREEYARARLSQQRGRSAERQRRWRQFRTAIENYVASVQPGNQTALNTAASPFASFLADMHRRIHIQYHQFLNGLRPGGPMSDMTLQTRLEIILGGDGSVDRVGVVRTSGNLQFDLGAFTAVMDAVPFAEPPSSILSGDGNVYLHWTFKRNQPFCHVSHAAPYILPNPPAGRTDREPGTPIPGGPEWGSVVPEGTERNYGLGRGDAESESESEGASDAEADGEPEPEPEADDRPSA